jgi:hypothetical protein
MNTMYIIKMTRTTSGEVVAKREVSGYTRAYTLYNEMCDERGYVWEDNPMNGGFFAGGHGHDFSIEMYETSEDDSDETTYEPF